VAEPLGQGEAYLVRRLAPRRARAAPAESLERADKRARELATEQAALRQVATLVAFESSPDQLFAVVADQVARVFDVPLVRLIRYEPDGSVAVGAFTKRDSDVQFPVGSRLPLDSPGAVNVVRETGRAARIEDYVHIPGPAAAAARRAGLRSGVASPIVVDGRLWGAILIASPRPEPLPQDTEIRLADFTELLATAIANAESRAAVRRLAEEQAALRRVATLVARGATPEETFSAVSKEVAGLFSEVDPPSLVAGIVRFDPGPEFVLVGVSNPDGQDPLGSRWGAKHLFASTRVLRTGRSARVEASELELVGGPDADFLHRHGIRYQLGSPIHVQGHLWGAIAVNSATPPPREIGERLESFTELVATAIANSQARENLAQLAEEQAALRRVATLVARGATPEETFSAVSSEVGRLFDAEVALARFEPDGSGMVVVGLTEGIPVVSIGTRWKLEDFLASTAVYRTGRPARNDHTGHRTASGPVADSLRQMSFVSTVAAPIVVEGNLWGTLTVSDQRQPLPPDTEERVAKFTELVGTAIANAESRAALRQLADEQAALRRVAELVARGVSSDELFRVVSEEVAELFGSEAGVARFETDGSALVFVGLTEGIRGLSVGASWPLKDFPASSQVYHTGRPARSDPDSWQTSSGPAGEAIRANELVSNVSAPIVVDGKPWGAISVADRRRPLPPDAEERVAKFTKLVATAIANAESHTALGQLAEEQAALRRVAELVAHGAGPGEVFEAVSIEVAGLFGAEAGVARFEPDGSGMVLAGLSEGMRGIPIGTRWPLEDFLACTEVHRTRRAARSERTGWEDASGPAAEALREMGPVSMVAAPIVVEGDLWGAITVADTRKSLPGNAEERIEKFTELVATAIGNTESRAELAASEARARELANEQAALRRVATLVARGVSPEEIFSAVSDEMGRLFGSPQAFVGRFDPDGSAMVVVGVSGGIRGVSIGSRWELEDHMASTGVYRTGRPVRRERSDFEHAAGRMADLLREVGAVATVGAPIVVEGNLWGFVTVTCMERLPADAEQRLEKFTELLATAIANAESRGELAASRARIIAATDEARRRIERDLHDGAQQQLVTLMVALRRAEARLPTGSDELRADLTRVADGLTSAVDELRELSRGIHPSILSEGGVAPALKALGRRSPVRVKLDMGFEERLPEPLEVAAYYTVSEALTNASKHANAPRVWVSLRVEHDMLVLSIRDEGVGGADPGRGSGLTGLRDRIEALGGTFRIESPPGSGTSIQVEIPIVGSVERKGEPHELLAQATTSGSLG
jgi:GAF domain-containing protein